MHIATRRQAQIVCGLVVFLVLAGGGYRVMKFWSAQRIQSIQAAQVVRIGEFVPGPVSSLTPKREAYTVHSPTTVGGAGMVLKDALLLPILMYHHVGPLPIGADAMRRDLTVSTEDFEAEVVWLLQHGYTTVSLIDAYHASQGTLSLPPKSVVLTFDDGYADVFQYAVPILQKYHLQGSFAVVPGFFGQPDYATWDMVEEAHKLGMEIVSHTENHFDGSNPKFNAAYIREDLEQSLRELETRLGPIPRILVYPYGHYTAEYIHVAQSVGFTMALTTHYGRHVDPHNLMLTPRVRVHGQETMEKFEENITGIKQLK